MFSKIKKHTISFKHAFRGIWLAYTTQPNFKIHTLFGIVVTLLGLWLKLSHIEWTIIMFTVLWVFLAEMINTAIESMVDLITTEYRQQAKTAKDVSAGAVLLSALGSVMVGLFILLPKIILMMKGI